MKPNCPKLQEKALEYIKAHTKDKTKKTNDAFVRGDTAHSDDDSNRQGLTSERHNSAIEVSALPVNK